MNRFCTPKGLRRLAGIAAALALAAGALTAAGNSSASAVTVVSQASAQALNAHLSGAAAIATSPTAVSNDGTQPGSVMQSQPVVDPSAIRADALAVGTLDQQAQANPDGSSFACAGVAEPGGAVQIGAGDTGCTASGGSGSGVTLDLSRLPGGGNALSSVADVSVTLNTVTAFASDDGVTTPPLRTATVAGGSVTVTLVGGVLPPITLPLTIDPSPNADLLTAIVSSLSGNPLLTGVVQALTSDLSGIVNLETNFQPPPVSGTFSVTALHVGVLGASAGALDVATATVGPNTPPPAIAVDGLDLTSGSSYGGTLVTITGTGFTGATAVNFGTTPAITFAVDSDTTIIATSPADTPGAVPVTVVTPIGTSNGEPFTFISPAPIISPNGLDPASGPTTGGTTVTLNGTGLFGVTAVEFGDAMAPTVTVDSDTSITAVTPPQAAGPVQVTALNPSAGTSNVETFTFVAPSSAATLSPTSGPIAGGTTVTISGTDLAGATSVDFGPSPATVVSDTGTEIVATTPPGALGDAVVTVATPGGTASPGDFAYVAAPTIATTGGIVADTGPTAGGTTVTITGTNFTGATTVDFGATPASTFTVVSDTTITATSPADPAGGVPVTVGNSGGTSNGENFTFVAPTAVPTISTTG
jgi:IPT/TIG domain